MSDELFQLLSASRVRQTLWGVIDITAPGGLHASPVTDIRTHLVLEGSAVLEIADRQPLPLGRGDLVVMLDGAAHSVKDAPLSPSSCTDGAREIAARGPPFVGSLGGGGARTRLVSGAFDFRGGFGRGVARLLPRIVHLKSRDGAPPTWAGLMASPAGLLQTSMRAGAMSIMCRFAEFCLAHALQDHLAGASVPVSATTARIHRALGLMEDSPEADWTVSNLARAVGMSRSAFALAFASETGDSPMKRLAEIRLDHAAQLLRVNAGSIAEIARQAGYRSEAGLFRAFKQRFGAAPGAYRRMH